MIEFNGLDNVFECLRNKDFPLFLHKNRAAFFLPTSVEMGDLNEKNETVAAVFNCLCSSIIFYLNAD
ncbi:hypothetical protein D3C77_578540 [compost metagenome]